MSDSVSGPQSASAGSASYQVVARRYRPQSLDDLVGQEHVVSAIRNAIRLNRITHAYLFTGTRGVGKTSMARIFAKCLNCVNGPTDKPCNQCDICKAISVGQDVDVIEIDGASNNGVEAVRELRANVGLRPSRSRFKIYYIDEVHMLSTGAFNALLKTLEEPPEHVKFLFATTESHKIPITVLSRCQRFDFAGISPEKIVETLDDICRKEGVEVETDALWTVARRAGGSMRDAQSLLERLLIHNEGTLTDEKAREILGLASDDRVLEILEAASANDLASVLAQVDTAIAVGVQPGDLINGILELLRDAMVQAAGSTSPLIAVGSRQRPRLDALAQNWGIETILAAMQILAETKARMKGNSQGRLLAELGLARVTRLENLAGLGEIIDLIKQGGASASPRRTSGGPAAPSPANTVATQRIAPAPGVTVSRPSAVEITATNDLSRPRPEPIRQVASVVREEPRDQVRDDPPPTGSLPDHYAEPVSGSQTDHSVPGGLNLEMIQHRWSEFVEKLGFRYGMIIASYPPARLGPSGEIVCQVPTAYRSMIEKVGSPEDLSKIA
ncbi:MAG: polymerase subunit tau, partial [Planctomycetota bacterium]